MRPYGSRRNDNDYAFRGGVEVVVHGKKSSRARAKREDDSLHDLDLRNLQREMDADPVTCQRECCRLTVVE